MSVSPSACAVLWRAQSTFIEVEIMRCCAVLALSCVVLVSAIEPVRGWVLCWASFAKLIPPLLPSRFEFEGAGTRVRTVNVVPLVVSSVSNGSVDTRDSSQNTFWPSWDSVSTLAQVVSTLEAFPEPLLGCFGTAVEEGVDAAVSFLPPLLYAVEEEASAALSIAWRSRRHRRPSPSLPGSSQTGPTALLVLLLELPPPFRLV
ncbi:hypothetical protein Taro_008254 [Colocasia esculenta]|uniref:Uncharacterized protein n=1 Tax=Colocasia esculenta TaxID=4460 RepID=A0A843U6E1_COLES|nr:hypothetical protein [Colocasia esculenta]